MRVCTKCGKKKRTTSFSFSRKVKGTRQSRCKACSREYKAEYRKKNPEKLKESKRQDYQKHKDRYLAASTEWVRKNPSRAKKNKSRWYQENKDRLKQRQLERIDEVRAWRKQYRKKNAAKILEYQRQWQAKHREELRARCRDYYHRKSPAIKKYIKQWCKENPETCRSYKHKRKARKRAAGGTYSGKQWKEVKAAYGFHCLACGRKEPEIKLVPDHVIPFEKLGPNVLENLQPLCGRCNNKKATKTTDYRKAGFAKKLLRDFRHVQASRTSAEGGDRDA